jgi:chain length determinant protein tyrosine kinase EpsG
MEMTQHPPLSARAELSIGRILLDQGKLTALDAERVLSLQKESSLRFGEAAIQLGLISEADLQHVLAKQFDYPYLSPGEGAYSQDLIAAYAPFSAQVESLRALRSQLMLRWFMTGKKTLAIVSANPGEGASYLAANLAVVFSQLGERTLLIDANLRNPGVGALFSLGNGMGLSDILAGRADLSAIVRIPAFVDLSVLKAGTLPPNPAELLSRPNLADMLDVLSTSYDVILLDTPAANTASDFQIVAARARGAIVTVRKHNTRLNEVAGIKSMVMAAGAEVVGAVLNDH